MSRAPQLAASFRLLVRLRGSYSKQLMGFLRRHMSDLIVIEALLP